MAEKKLPLQYLLGLKVTHKIIQYSPPRTGSTLVFNILQEIFPGYSINKKHTYKKRYDFFPIIITYRDPVDAIASSFQVDELEVNDENLKAQIAKFDKSKPLQLIELAKRANILMLQYEKFLNDFEYIFDSFESFFGITVSQEKRAEITQKLNIEKVDSQVSNMGSFENYDPNTHWHGKHVSKYKGKAGYGYSFFRPQDLDVLKEHYRDFYQYFGYGDTKQDV